MDKKRILLTLISAVVLVLFYQNCSSSLSSGNYSASSLVDCESNPEDPVCGENIDQNCVGSECNDSTLLELSISARKSSDLVWENNLRITSLPYASFVEGINPSSEQYDKIRFSALNVMSGAKVCFALRDMTKYGAGDQDELVTKCKSESDYVSVAEDGTYNSSNGKYTKEFSIKNKECVIRNMYIYNPGNFENRIDLGYFTRGDGLGFGGPCPADAVEK